MWCLSGHPALPLATGASDVNCPCGATVETVGALLLLLALLGALLGATLGALLDAWLGAADVDAAGAGAGAALVWMDDTEVLG